MHSKLIEYKPILYRKWRSPVRGAVLLLVHGLGGHSGRWDKLAEYFVARGISSYALELEGFGLAPGLRGHISSFRKYCRNIQILRDLIRNEHPNAPIFVVGESMGGLICFSCPAQLKASFKGMVLISPAFGNRLRLSLGQYLSWLYAIILHPRKQFRLDFNIFSCTRDIDYGKIIEADSREHRWASARLLWEIIKAQLRAPIKARKIDIPVLFLLSGNDKLVNPNTAKRIFYLLHSADKQLKEYPRMFHALTIDLDRENVFEDIKGWVDQHV